MGGGGGVRKGEGGMEGLVLPSWACHLHNR